MSSKKILGVPKEFFKLKKDKQDGTYLSNRGYAIDKTKFPESIVKEIKKILSVKPNVTPELSHLEINKGFSVYRESSKKLYIPRAFGFSVFGEPKFCKRKKPVEIDVEFKGKLRDIQIEATNAFIKSCDDSGKRGGIISLQCGGGKTCCALYLIAKMGLKALVIVHKDFLLTQWRERIEQFLPDARVGLIKATKFDIEHKDIVLASLQSLSMKSFDEDAFEEFGLVAADECHHLSAEVFSRALPKVTVPYMLGLSATLNRKDGLRKVFEWYLGGVVYSKVRKDTNILVNMIEYFDNDRKYSKEHFMFVGGRQCVNRAKMINNICDFEKRTKKILKIIYKVLDNEPERNVLLLSDRRNHLTNLKEMIEKDDKYNCGLYMGGMKEHELKESEDKKIILGTFAIASEGFDVPRLDTVVLASPKSDIEQSVGRVMRKKEEERDRPPLIIDMVDAFSVFKRQSEKRKKFYEKKQYKITYQGKFDDNATKELEQELKSGDTFMIQDLGETLPSINH